MAGIIIAQTVQFGDELPVYTWKKGGKSESDDMYRLCLGSVSDPVTGNEIIEVDQDKNVRFYGQIALDNLQLNDNSLNGSVIKDGTITGGKIQSGTTITATLVGSAEQAQKDGDGNVISTTYATKDELGNYLGKSETAVASTMAFNDGENRNIVNTYATKSELTTKADANSTTTALATKIDVSGAKGEVSGCETAQVATGTSATITKNSAYTVIWETKGACTLNFTPSATKTDCAIKIIDLTATGATTLTVTGGTWANGGEAPTWGDAGKHLTITASFIAGRVDLFVSNNDQA